MRLDYGRAALIEKYLTFGESSTRLLNFAHDSHVNVSYFRDRTREWVSVSGRAILSRDRDLIDSLYKPDWKIWLGDTGDGVRTVGPHDPRIALIIVEADTVVYSKNDRPMPLVLFQMAKSLVTGEPPKVADPREIGREELR